MPIAAGFYDGNVTCTGKLTPSMVTILIVAATGGLLFGYDIGVSGGVTTMNPFLEKFYPDVARKAGAAKQSTYCMYDSQVLTLFTSSLYLAALVSSLVAGSFSAAKGRKATLVCGGSIFLVGCVVIAAAMNIAMLIIGRILLGFGVGFSNQAAPVYLSEMAPPKWRGAFGTCFDFFVGVGVVVANVVNFFVAQLNVDWSWRLAVGLAAVPAVIMTSGALFIPDTTVSLVQRGKMKQARDSLSQVRGIDSDVEKELTEIVNQNEALKSKCPDPYRKIFEREYRPHLVLSVAALLFQQLTGVNIAAFYAPVLFRSVGFGSDSALIGAVIMGVIDLVCITASCLIVDRVGRRTLFAVGGTNMLICQIALAWLLAVKVPSGYEPLTKGTALGIMVFMCFYAAGFGYSWGPLSFLIPTEVLPTEVRAAGNGISISINFLITFLLSQSFVTMLCHLKFAVFLFYAAWIVFMTVFMLLFLPETKGIPLEAMRPIWERHWYWGKFVQEKMLKEGEISLRQMG